MVKGSGPTLLGRDWLRGMRLNWSSIRTLTAHNWLLTLNQLIEKYAEVFQPELGTFKKFQAHLQLNEGVRPVYLCPHSVPFALKESVERELERQEQNGTLCHVEHSEWASPIVPVPKKDGTLRICGDYKVTRYVPHDREFHSALISQALVQLTL